ncbi:unnamed protein product [Acanthoscelides obtectus]|uniref:C-type lectin domain-containing protein n=1 Tax=Acanthoscelides obtectus TaxID=200917 RepID=A0A9P0KH73_ACAOB|nr:unnamed protein product [Acanthoscelides obtectus]CAK1638615.1 hypothetical protein AOBTE_LOCUS10703 [Acanthoscelides obtectus]
MNSTILLIICIFALVPAFSTNNVLSLGLGSNEDGEPSFSNCSPRVPLVHYKSTSYYIGSIYNGTQTQAEIFCSYHGMRLLSIESDAENNFLISALSEHFEATRKVTFAFWSSGRRYDEDEWMWVSTGIPVEYANWNPPNEPTHNPNEDCILMSCKMALLPRFKGERFANLNE